MAIYKGFTIRPHGNGFEFSPGTLIRIASFIVQKDDVVACFAFAEGMLNRMSHPEINDEDLLREAEEIIKRDIDNDKIRHLEEYTFEYHPSSFIDVDNPKWWIKTLKQYYG